MNVLVGWSGCQGAGQSEEDADQPQEHSQHMDKMKMQPKNIKKSKKSAVPGGWRLGQEAGGPSVLPLSPKTLPCLLLSLIPDPS